MTEPFPSPTIPQPDRAAVFLGYLDFFRSVVVDKAGGLGDVQFRTSVLPSGWTPAQLVNHLTHVERRWLVWGFLGEDVGDPWADENDGRWSAEDGTAELWSAYRAQAAVTTAVVSEHRLDEVGQPGERWDGADPPTLERILFHLLQEYARHVGHLDVVSELVDGRTGE